MIPKQAKIKFNGGRGALLCEVCNIIIRQDFDPLTIEDKKWYCERHVKCQTSQVNCGTGGMTTRGISTAEKSSAT